MVEAPFEPGETSMAVLAAQNQPTPVITSYTIVKPKVYGAVLLPVAALGGARSIPAQVGIPILSPPVRPAAGTEHPHEGSISTDDGRPVRAVRNDPTVGQ
jgi:hypothetical protein